MSRKLLLVAIISVSLLAFGQRQVSAGSSAKPSTTVARGTAMPATQNSGFAAQQGQATGMNTPSQTDTGVPASPGVFNNGGWISTYAGPGAAGGVLLATPTASFASPQLTVGVSNAGQAGISNYTTVTTGVEETANASTMAYTNMPEYGPVSPALAAVSAPSPEAGPANDLGGSFYSDNIGVPLAAGPSVAEVAGRYRAAQAQQNIRTYTNSDVPHENAGRLGSTFLAANTAPPVPESSAYQSAPAPSSTSQQSQPAASSQPQAQPQPAPGEQESQSQPAGSATAPQIHQPQSTNQESTSSLPATSTFLPLLGLLGLVSGGLGIWYRQRRR
jgi:hypothetical protein